MTTTHENLPAAAVVGAVEAGHHLPSVHVRDAVSRVPIALLALDAVGAAVSVLVVERSLGLGSSLVVGWVVTAWVALLGISGAYAARPGARYRLHAPAIARAAGGLAISLWVVAALTPTAGGEVNTARESALLVLLVPLATLGLRRVAAFPEPASRVVVAGDARSVEGLLHDLRRAAASGTASLHPVAICVPESEVDTQTETDVPVWAGLDRVADVADANQADAVIVVPGPQLHHGELRRLRDRLRLTRTELMVSTGLRDVSSSALDLGPQVGTRLVHVRPASHSGLSYLLKGAVDRAVAGLLLVGLLPLLAVLVLLVRLDSPGAAVFRQTRVGRHGRPFTVVKLRTMHTGAEDGVGALAGANDCGPDSLLFKLRRDPRITAVGAVLRKYSLDELPQLVNVVRGEMSLIGPRPALPSEAHGYDADLRRRLEVKPGMTGLWQVSGRSDLTWEETVRLDLAYVDNWSWRMDLAIAARTLRAVVGHRGAY